MQSVTLQPMSLQQALAFVIDYGKFIGTLWNYYIVLIVAIIGWLVTLRSKDLPLDDAARITLIVAFIGVSFFFGLVLYANHRQLVGLMQVTDELAKIDRETVANLAKNRTQDVRLVYDRVFDSSRMASDLNLTLYWVLPAVTLLVSLFMFFITRRAPEKSKRAGHS